MDLGLKGKIAMVGGASKGLGFAVARALAGEGVTVTGRVADTRPHLDGAAVVVAPLSLGGGMRVKVLEALAMGKALVATPRALAGIELTPGDQALVGETDA